MIKLFLLTSGAFVLGAIVFNVTYAPAKLSACDVHTRGEAAVWAIQNPGVGYKAACPGLSGS